MPLPEWDANGYLLPGIHAATLSEVISRYGSGSDARERQIRLLQLVVEAALSYPTIKRVLVWGSFVTAKLEPNDLDYSIVVSIEHQRVQTAPEHRRFFVPVDARQFYGVDKNCLVIKDYPVQPYAERIEFICLNRAQRPCGAVEISLRGEVTGEEH